LTGLTGWQYTLDVVHQQELKMKTLLYVKRISKNEVASGAENYGLRDQKGRTVGYRWSIVLSEVQVLSERQAIDEEYKAYFRMTEEEAGKPYRVWGSPTRDGMAYGPTNWTSCASLDAAQKNVATRIKNARKRDTKKFAKENA